MIATGAPYIRSRTLHFNGVAFQPPDLPVPEGMTTDTLCPRRYLLDQILADAAVEAGAEFRDRFPVRELIQEGDTVVGVRAGPRGKEVEERARVVIGADGIHSLVAKSVQPEEYDAFPSYTYGNFTYWTGVEDTGMHIYFFDDKHGILVFPTNDGKTCIGVGGAVEEFKDFRADIENNYLKIIDRIPALAEQVRKGERERYLGTAEMPNYFRKPYGPGWALVGDSGYHRDFITGLGINDAFLQAELLADALDDAWSGRQPLDAGLAAFQQKRDAYLKPTYDLTVKMATGEIVEPAEFMKFGLAMMQQMPV